MTKEERFARAVVDLETFSRRLSRLRIASQKRDLGNLIAAQEKLVFVKRDELREAFLEMGSHP